MLVGLSNTSKIDESEMENVALDRTGCGGMSLTRDEIYVHS